MTEIKPVLEPAAQDFADATDKPPYLFDMPVTEGRKTVDSVQDGDIPAPEVDVTDVLIPGGPKTEVSIKVYRPAGSASTLPVLLFTHGAGWVFGDAHTHDRLVRELTTRSGAPTVFTNYSLSPKPATPPHWRRSTSRWSGSPSTVPSTASTRSGSPWPGTPSAGT